MQKMNSSKWSALGGTIAEATRPHGLAAFADWSFRPKALAPRTPIPMPCSKSASRMEVTAFAWRAQILHPQITIPTTHQRRRVTKSVPIETDDLASHTTQTTTYATRVNYTKDSTPLSAPSVASQLAAHRRYIFLTATAKRAYA